MVDSTSAVSVLVIDWTTTGTLEPTRTAPIWTVAEGRRWMAGIDSPPSSLPSGQFRAALGGWHRSREEAGPHRRTRAAGQFFDGADHYFLDWAGPSLSGPVLVRRGGAHHCE